MAWRMEARTIARFSRFQMLFSQEQTFLSLCYSAVWLTELPFGPLLQALITAASSD
jgi:hypothetical protein